ncbi:hypothetical protein DRJ25_05625 [Candidatus Woesearchaeota archaeon]|nr:MAG: hypothetical protein DRJ25_05625 [Candidatus Woesearchaeota archaeon]
MIRVKGRVIGREGKTRELIEETTETTVCVYGKTIGILGRPENVMIARKAVENLLKGSTHSSVYKWLEKRRKELKREEMLGKDEFKGLLKEEKEEDEGKKAKGKAAKEDQTK